MMSSFRTRAVNDIETMFKNSFSKRIKDIIMMADPGFHGTERGNMVNKREKMQVELQANLGRD
jgi:hypothetical protein